MILTYLYFHKNVLSDMGIYRSVFQKKTYILQTYLFVNYLKEMK
jgi:hypothetical protein